MKYKIHNSRFLIVAAVALSLLAVACHKEHQCKCDVTDTGATNKLQLLTVDNSLKCEDITEMAVEKMIVDSVTGDHTFTRVEIQHLSCRNYAENED